MLTDLATRFLHLKRVKRLRYAHPGNPSIHLIVYIGVCTSMLIGMRGSANIS